MMPLRLSWWLSGWWVGCLFFSQAACSIQRRAVDVLMVSERTIPSIRQCMDQCVEGRRVCHEQALVRQGTHPLLIDSGGLGAAEGSRFCSQGLRDCRLRCAETAIVAVEPEAVTRQRLVSRWSLNTRHIAAVTGFLAGGLMMGVATGQ